MNKITLPNIFGFAKSELNQDAFFAWLIKCADPIYLNLDPDLCRLGQDFIRLIIGNEDLIIEKIEVGRQWNKIDIWIEINDDIFVAIEDKTETTEHDEQLERYKQTVHAEYDGHRDKLFFTYIKTGNESKWNLEKILSYGYRIILRDDLLKMLISYVGDNIYVNHFREHLQFIENETQKYKSLPVSEWHWYAWQGFYQEINNHIDLGWKYVPNPNEGFLGAFWYWVGDGKNIEFYLQFEESKLCFKIWCGYKNHSVIRNACFNSLMKVKEGRTEENEIQRPQRFGYGETMTIAVVNKEILFGSNLIDIKRIVSKLHLYEKLIDLCYEDFLNNDSIEKDV